MLSSALILNVKLINKNLRSGSARELDQITRSDVVARQERRKGINRIVDTQILREGHFDILEDYHGSIGSVSNEVGQGEANGVVERQAEGLVDVLTTLRVEQVGLQVVQEREERAAL